MATGDGVAARNLKDGSFNQPKKKNMKLAKCKCAETLDGNGQPMEEVVGHNCAYIRKRNENLPEASEWAQRELDASGLTKEADRSVFFNKKFAHKMRELCSHL